MLSSYVHLCFFNRLFLSSTNLMNPCAITLWYCIRPDIVKNTIRGELSAYFPNNGYIRNIQQNILVKFYLSCLGPLAYLLLKTFTFICLLQSFDIWMYLLKVITESVVHFGCTYWRLLQKVLCKLNFMSTFYYYHWIDTSAGGLLVPEGIIHPVFSVSITGSIPLLVDC